MRHCSLRCKISDSICVELSPSLKSTSSSELNSALRRFIKDVDFSVSNGISVPSSRLLLLLVTFDWSSKLSTVFFLLTSTFWTTWSIIPPRHINNPTKLRPVIWSPFHINASANVHISWKETVRLRSVNPIYLHIESFMCKYHDF